ncbi:MAG: flagellar hook-associated protein FlgK [Lachnospiraceae bacterium]|nr:flagellar hook-associated protein FlgK [Lachnospiraceae bacterium]
MPSTFFGLHVAYSGLNAFQASINTTANNVSNVETEGYSRQSVVKQSASALRVYQKYGSVGAGVTAEKVTQMRDEYYDQKYWYTNPSLGFYDRKVYYMDQIEDMYTDSTANPGFSSIFGKMFNSLDSIKDNAGESSIRNEFISDGQKLCNYFVSTANQLQELQSTINDEIKTTVENVNSIAQKVALLNKQINTIEQQGGQANELRDQRALLVDELSKIVSVDAQENEVVNSNYPDMKTGATYYSIKVNGQTLVDNYDYQTLSVVSREAAHNQCDVQGLYDIIWTDSGNEFNVRSKNLDGSLKALFEVRDGNDDQNLQGVVDHCDSTSITLTGLNITDINALCMPSGGMLNVNNYNLEYTSFEAKTDATGKIETITFNLFGGISQKTQDDITNQHLAVGASVNYKGIPYYQNQMSAFLRNFTSVFNDIHDDGQDLYGKQGTTFFTVDDKVMDREGVFSKDITGGGSGTTFASTDDTYYRLTALNADVSKAIALDPRKLAATENINQGVDAYDQILKLLALESDTIVYRGNSADKFLQTIYADVTVDTQECAVFKSNYENVMKAIQQQRDSVSAVDEDEEAMDLVKFQNAYNLASKVISVMTEMYDQLILNTGV